MQLVFYWAPKLARECDSKHWFPCGADGRSYGHVITKFSRMGRLPHSLSYGAPSTRALRARVELRYILKCGYYNYSVERYFEFCSDKRLRLYSSNKLKINRVRTELFKGTFFNLLPYLWNNLPDKLRTSNLSLSLFKKQCIEFYTTSLYCRSFNKSNSDDFVTLHC